MFYSLLNNFKSIFENFFADAAFKELFIDFRKTIFIIKLLNRIQKIAFTNRKKEKKKRKKKKKKKKTEKNFKKKEKKKKKKKKNKKIKK